VTFALGGSFIILSYIIQPLLLWAIERWNWDTYAMMEWSINETLQLQSAAHEELGMGTWTRKIGEVPVTKVGERLAVVDGDAWGGPRFRALGKWEEWGWLTGKG
jgi:hypothetical protein